MRILMLGVVAAGGCFSPTVADCQFTCTDQDGECPSGQQCQLGVCRDEGAMGSCGTSAQCAPSPCGGTPVMSSDIGHCIVACSAGQTWNDANAACTGAWHLAILDTVPKRMAASTVVATGVYWVGLTRATAGWSWSNGTDVSLTDPVWDTNQPGVNVLKNCASFDTSSEKCSADGCTSIDNPSLCEAN